MRIKVFFVFLCIIENMGIDRTQKLILSAFFFLSLTSQILFSETSVANFVQFQPGARSAGLSGSFASVSGDLWNVFNAPSEMALLKGFHAGLTHVIYIEGISYEAAAASFPISKKDFRPPVMSAGLLYKHYNLLLTDEGGEYTGGQIAPADLCGIIGLSFYLRRNMILGLNAKFLYTSIDESQSWAPALDGSFLLRTMSDENPFHVLFAFQNLGIPVGFGSDKNYLPLNLQFAAVYRVCNTSFTVIDINAVVRQTIFQSPEILTGYEQTIGNLFTYRIGFRFIDTDWGWISFGAGFRLQAIKIDYSFQPLTRMGAVHQITCEVRT
jgi:hypothetical protein